MRAVLLVAAALALAVPASAYMPPEAYIMLRAGASQHIQLSIEKVGNPPAGGYGDCPVGGHVARIFRDQDDALAEGMPLTVLVPCMLPDVADMPVGGTAWTQLGTLRDAAVIELYLNPVPGGLYTVADHADGLLVLAAPTDAPQVVDKPRP